MVGWSSIGFVTDVKASDASGIPAELAPASISTSRVSVGENKKETGNTHAQLNAFARFTDFLDDHIHAIRLGVVLLGFTGVLLIGKSVRLMKKFCSVSDIPEEFIKKQVTLRGKVRGHESDHLIVEHLPIMQGWTILGRKPRDSSLAIHLAGVVLPEVSRHHLAAIAPTGSLIRFKSLARTQNQGLDSIVYRRKWLLPMQLNVRLVKQGLASVRLVEPFCGSTPASDRFVQRLARAETSAKKRGRGMWAGPPLSERLRMTRDDLRDGVKARVSLLARPFTVTANTGKSVAVKVGAFVGRLRRRPSR